MKKYELMPCCLEYCARTIYKMNINLNMDTLLIILECARNPNEPTRISKIMRDANIISDKSKFAFSKDMKKFMQETGFITIDRQFIDHRYQDVATVNSSLILCENASYEYKISRSMREMFWEIRAKSSRSTMRICLFLFGVYVRKITHSGDLYRFVSSHLDNEKVKSNYSNGTLANILADLGLIKIIRMSDLKTSALLILPTREI